MKLTLALALLTVGAGAFTPALAATGKARLLKTSTARPKLLPGIGINCTQMLTLMENPMTLFSLVAVPYTLGKKTVGFEVKYFDAEKFPKELDLRSGDVVTHIQGRALNSLQAAQAAFWSFQERKPKFVDAVVLRNAKNTNVKYLCRW